MTRSGTPESTHPPDRSIGRVGNSASTRPAIAIWITISLLLTSPTAESVAVLIDRAKKFRTDVDGVVLQETKDWVTEFQNSMVQMEKDIVSQVAAVKAQIDKAAQAKEAAEQPGSLQLQIQNASKVDTGTMISVSLTDAQGKSIQETASGQSWARLNLLPGQYKVRIQATVKGQSVEDQKVVPVKPGEIANVQLAL